MGRADRGAEVAGQGIRGAHGMRALAKQQQAQGT